MHKFRSKSSLEKTSKRYLLIDFVIENHKEIAEADSVQITINKLKRK